MFARPFVLPAVFLLVAVVFAVTGSLFLGGAFVGISLGLGVWAIGAQRAVASLQWFGAGIAAVAVLFVARALLF